MKRVMMAAVAATLALPVVTLAAMIGDAERGQRAAGTMRVAIQGYDPRDILRGHYLRYRFAWDAEPGASGRIEKLCVLSAPEDAPARVRPLPAGDGGGIGECLFVLNGYGTAADRAAPGATRPPARMTFTPAGVASGELYVSEDRAEALERLLREGKVRLTIDLAVNKAGRAAVKAWHIDGKTPDAYFAK
jgi:hypothetical protein